MMIGELVGTIIFALSPQTGYLSADGSCLSDSDYQELSDVLHDGKNWPYGRCDAEHFRLPDLKNNADKSIPLIRVKP